MFSFPQCIWCSTKLGIWEGLEFEESSDLSWDLRKVRIWELGIRNQIREGKIGLVAMTLRSWGLDRIKVFLSWLGISAMKNMRRQSAYQTGMNNKVSDTWIKYTLSCFQGNVSIRCVRAGLTWERRKPMRKTNTRAQICILVQQEFRSCPTPLEILKSREVVQWETLFFNINLHRVKEICDTQFYLPSLWYPKMIIPWTSLSWAWQDLLNWPLSCKVCLWGQSIPQISWESLTCDDKTSPI